MSVHFRIICFAAASLLFLQAALAFHTQEERHAAVIAHLKATATALTEETLSPPPSTLGAWEQQRPALKEEILYMLGLSPMPERTPLNLEVTGVLKREGYRVEKLVFQSMPGLYVTGNLYVPDAASENKRGPAILYVCGHSPHPFGAKTQYQDRAIQFVLRGFVCLVVDTLEFGEVPGLHHGIHDLNMWDWLSLGYTPAGVEVWNAIRAIDYLETRPEVDPKRIGMTGISGGGATTWFTAAVDERVAAAAPVCSAYTFGSQAGHWRAFGQCDCIYFHNTYLRDFSIVAALIAPRPLLMINGRKDADFPPDGYHRVFEKAKPIYDLYGGAGADSDRIVDLDDDVGHQDTPKFKEAAREWMVRWLMPGAGDAAGVEGEVELTAPEQLACLEQAPANALNFFVHRKFTLTKSKDEPVEWSERRKELLAELRDKTFRWFPKPGESAPFATEFSRNSGGWAGRYAEYREFEFESEAGVPVRGQWFKPRNADEETPLVIYVKRAGDSIYFMDLDEMLPLMGRVQLIILNPRLTEHPISAKEYSEIERTASWAGRTVGAMQTWDVLRCVKWAREELELKPSSVTLFGKGAAAVNCLYAAALDEDVDRVIMAEAPDSHWTGPGFLNVRRFTDLPEVAALMAPRELVFLHDLPDAYEKTALVFRAMGVGGHLRTESSLPAALRLGR